MRRCVVVAVVSSRSLVYIRASRVKTKRCQTRRRQTYDTTVKIGQNKRKEHEFWEGQSIVICSVNKADDGGARATPIHMRTSTHRTKIGHMVHSWLHATHTHVHRRGQIWSHDFFWPTMQKSPLYSCQNILRHAVQEKYARALANKSSKWNITRSFGGPDL